MRHNLRTGSLIIALLVSLLALAATWVIFLAAPLTSANAQIADVFPAWVAVIGLIVIIAILFIVVIWSLTVARTFSRYRETQLASHSIRVERQLAQAYHWRAMQDERQWHERLQAVMPNEPSGERYNTTYAASPMSSAPQSPPSHLPEAAQQPRIQKRRGPLYLVETTGNP